MRFIKIMSKFKTIIFPLMFLIISFSVIAFGLGLFELPSELNFSGLFDFEFVPVSGGVHKNNTESLEKLKGDLLNFSENSFPEDVNALWYDMNTDLKPSEIETEAVKYAIYSDFLWMRNFVPDTVFIKPDTEKKYSHLKEDNGSEFDALAYLLYYCKDIGCKAYLVADEDIIYNSSGKADCSTLQMYLSSYDFSGVLLSVDGTYNSEAYYTDTEYFSKYIRENFKETFFGVEIHSNSDELFADSFVIKVAEDGLIDFGYVDCNTTTADESFPFLSVALWWDAFGDYYSIPLICEHRADMIFTNDTTWGYSTEINQQLKSLYNCPSFDGSCFYSVASLKNKKALARDLSIFLNDVASVSQKTFAVKTLELNGNKVKFSGEIIDDMYNLYCNDKRILINNKLFEDTLNLSPGLNTFDFFSNGGEYTYEVYNNTAIFAACSSDINSEDNEIVPFAVCPIGSDVYIIVNGITYELSEAVAHSVSDIPSGYAVFSQNIPVSQGKASDAKLSFVASCNGIVAVIDDGKSYIYYNDEIKDGISPFADNGLGTSLMCIIKSDNTEQISSVDDYDTYHPYKSSLLSNTIDYVKNINVSDEGYLRYELQSGINVYGTDAILINNGYNLPLNNVHLLSIEENQDKTVLSFSKDWLAPVTVSTDSVSFSKGYQQFSFNVEDFRLDYVDITFSYTENFYLDKELLFSSFSLFSRYELLRNSDKIILRLFLKDSTRFYGYDIAENDDGSISVSFKNRYVNSVAGKTVMLDAGHGGISMVGTALRDNSVSEAQITLAIAMKTKQYLENLGAKVVMTRVSDIGLSLYERTLKCESVNPDIFVSIHCDGSDSLSESGTHTFYYTPYSQPLAKSIHESLVSAYAQRIYVEADENYAKIDRKIKYYPFYVTRVDNCPSVLIETGFLTNYVEGNVLANPTNQDIVALAIANGISDYFYNY